jgi:hypothetical protein
MGIGTLIAHLLESFGRGWWGIGFKRADDPCSLWGGGGGRNQHNGMQHDVTKQCSGGEDMGNWPLREPIPKRAGKKPF